MSTTALRFFHGTTSTLFDKILAEGLQPQTNPSSSMRSNQSNIPGLSERAIFLAPCIEEAAYYAVSQAEHNSGDPVIFEVYLLSDSRLAVSDDYIAGQAVQAMLDKAGLPALEFDDDGDVHEYGTSSEAYYFWRELISCCSRDLLCGKQFDLERIATLTRNNCIGQDLEGLGHGTLAPEIWKAASEAARAALTSPWRNSIATDRDPSVAHFGPIPPEQLRKVSKALTSRAIANRSRGLGAPAEWKLETHFTVEHQATQSTPVRRKMRA